MNEDMNNQINNEATNNQINNNYVQQINPNNFQNSNQQPKKKSKVGIILLIVLVCLLPIILIAVMLISSGVMIYNNVTTDVVSTSGATVNLSTLMFNTQFENFEGDNKSWHSVEFLIAGIKTSNSNSDNKINVEVELNDGSKYNLESFDSSKIRPISRFSITCIKNDETGYIELIKINEL